MLAITLFASAPLLAAGSGTTTAGTDVSTQETPTTMTEQDDCWLPTLPSTVRAKQLLPSEALGAFKRHGDAIQSKFLAPRTVVLANDR